MAIPSAQGAHRHIMVAMGLLYVGFGVMAGLLQGGLPPILRARGVPVEQVAWTLALYLPIGLSFLWAPLVDRIRLPFLSPRIGWIVLAQLVAVAGLGVVASLEGASLSLLFAWGLLVAVAVATMDLALDALAVEMTSEDRKPMAASLKLGALATGSMLGGGVLVAALERWGWAITFTLVAGGMLLCVLPVLGLVAQERNWGGIRKPAEQAHWFACLRQPQMRKYLALLVVAAGVIFPLSALNRIMLVDVGVSMERIAWLVGTLQPLGLLVISVLVMPLIRQAGHQKTMLLLAVAGGICVLLIMIGHHLRSQTWAVMGTVGMSTVVGGLMVVYAALILRWSQGSEAATNYAVLFCSTRLAGIVTSVLAGKLVAAIDWQAFYALGLLALLASTAWMLGNLRHMHSDS